MAKDDKKLKRSKSAEKDSPKNKINNKRKKSSGEEVGPSIKKNKSYPVVEDERFQSVHYDPIFQNIPKKESKVEVDFRFDRMFTDESFGNRSRAKIDKRGKIKEKTESHLTRYYVEEKEKKMKKKNKAAIEEDKKIENEERESKDEEETDSEEDSESTELEESSSSDDDEEYDDFEDDEEGTINNDITQYLLANQGNVTTTNEETNRLAIVNLDWDNIKAADLYVALSSCLPSGGQLLSVSIYPTEFGLKCMEIEAAKGPSVLLDGNEDNATDESDSEDESEQNEKLRSYELNKLSYYHGVAVFDSSTTANHVYEFLDGTEFLSTANVFDLRFIPDSMEFKHPPRDAATEGPATYNAPDFETRALQHSDVKLTWEEDDPKRTKTLRRKFNPDELDELNEYLASSEDDSDEDGSEDENEGSEDENGNGKTLKKHRDGGKYRELLLSGNKSNSDEDEVGDMEVTFKPELEEINKRILEKKNKKRETVWEQVCQKNKEKKKARRNRSKNASSDDDSTDDDNTQGRENIEHDDFFMEDEPIKSNKSNEKVREGSSDLDEKEKEATRAELELLVADDNNDNVKGYKVKRNNKKVKGKKGKMEEVESKLPDVDASKDPRFSALFASHLYALDPTDPQYKRTSAYARLQSVKKNRNKNPQVSTNEQEPLNIETQMNDDAEPIDKEKYELNSAIKSIKKNLKNIKKISKSK